MATDNDMIPMNNYDEPEYSEIHATRDDNMITIRINYHFDILIEKLIASMVRKIRKGFRNLIKVKKH